MSSTPPGRPPPRGPGSPTPDGAPDGGGGDARPMARPMGPPPARPLLGPRALPPGVIPRAPLPPTAPPPGTPGAAPAVPLEERKPPPKSPPPPTPPPVAAPSPGVPPPRAPGGPPPGAPPRGPPTVVPVSPVLSPGPPVGAPPKGPVVEAFEGGKARAPPRGLPPPDTPPAVKPGGKAAPSLPPPGSLPPVSVPERAEEKSAVPLTATAPGAGPPAKPITPSNVPASPLAPQAPAPGAPSVPPAVDARPAPQPGIAVEASKAGPARTPPAAPPGEAPKATPPVDSKPTSPPGPQPSVTSPPTARTPPGGPPSAPTSPVPGGPPARSPARPKPPPRPGDLAPPDQEGGGVSPGSKLVRSINPDTGLPYGMQPAPPSGPPPPETKAPSPKPPAEGEEAKPSDDKEAGGEKTPKGRKPPTEAPPPLPGEIKVVVPPAPAPPPPPEAMQLEEELGDTVPEAPPPPPPPMEDELVPSDLLAEEAAMAQTRKRLKRGRLHLYLVNAKNVRKKDQIAAPTNLSAFVTASLGKVKDPVKVKSQVLKKAGASMDFKRDELVLNIAEPESLIVGNAIHLVLELWDQGAWQEDILGRGEVPVLPFMDSPGSKFDFPVTLLYPGDTSSNMELNASARFEHAKVGLLVFTLYEGRQLKSRGKLDNFVTVNLGEKYQKRSSSVKDGRGSPYFKEEQVIMWASGSNWVDDVWLRVWDDDGANNDVIGEVRFSALSYMSITPDKFAPQVFGLTRRPIDEPGAEPEPTGEVVVKVEFLVAGTMSITVVEAKRLRKTNKAVGRQDPYVVLKMDGLAVALTRKTKVDKDGGSEPVWNETLVFECVDQYLLEVEVWDQDMRGRDEMIGKCSFSLLSVYKKGYIDTWVVVKRQADDGSPEESGDVHLVFDFWGPSGIAYPQHQPSVDSYDERGRVNLPDDAKSVKAGAAAKAKQELAVQQKDKQAFSKGEQGARSYEFTDDEIEEAFRFIDLDKNNFIGAAEVRHILVCMGELVTDEEIDAMIYLVDADGDGQVSFREFYKMVIHPNPAQYDCRASKEAEMLQQQQEEKKADYDREREMAERQEKRKLFGVLIKDNNIGVAESRKVFDRYRSLSLSMSRKGTDFDTFCTLLGVLPTGQYHKLFNLYDRDGGGYIDMKEFLLGLFNFVNLDKEEKVSLIFQLFDEDRSGFLSEDEIREILKATHLQTAEAVKGKLTALMKQVKSADRTLSYEEFVIIAKKFPTILFPPNVQLNEDEDNINPITGKKMLPPLSPVGLK